MEPLDAKPAHRLDAESAVLKLKQKELGMEIKSLEERNVGLAMENKDLKSKNKSLMTKTCQPLTLDNSELYSPLLSLPGERRNQIYGYLDVESDLALEASLETIRLGRSPAGMFMEVPRGYQGLASTNRQLHEEVHSYLLGHGNINVGHLFLQDLCRGFGSARMQSIGTLTVNVFYALHLSALDTASVAMDASFPGCSLDTISIAKYLLPVCKKGNLRRIVIEGGGYPYSKFAMISQTRTMRPDEIVEQLRCLLQSEALSRHISVDEKSEYYS
ncbi:hypothetical protein E8E13_003693 [Curvularia kusanoi]|uniref:Uncharacterized protein n=1 Tax=Curvularia kusanoi TaxID=90978 RepID=A0A9P4TD26_CURKU|nr:hypothetical protein E8E13_003693 [Curvularia kusanoi]